jgi:ribose transport system substrate-binding protein
VSDAIDRALAAHVKVVCDMCDTPQVWLSKGVIDTGINFTEQGKLMAYAILAHSGGSAHVVVTEDPGNENTVDRANGLVSVISQCAGCSVERLTIPATDSTSPGPPEWTAYLAAHPQGITDVVSYYDGMTTGILKTVANAGRSITVNGYDGDQTVVHLLATDTKNLGDDVTEPFTFASWAAIDAVARAKAGLPAWQQASSLPNAIINASNARTFSDLVPSGSWQSGFLKAWGIQ